MNDRELLEFAAKAAGIDVHTIEDADGVVHWDGWNPLTDDGDALRLAVKLHLIVGTYSSYVSVCGTYTPDGYEVPDEIVVYHSSVNNCPYAATRRAIVYTAAEIGKYL
jgi:hypothetical protein